jgi:predicted transposase/invertase (TIGR01784 family)
MEEDNNQNGENVKNDLIYKWVTEVKGKPFIYLINNLFDEHYPLEDVEMDIVSDKKLIDAELTIAIMDTLILIEYDEKKKVFHIELQTLNDKNMHHRMLEYGFMYALNEMNIHKSTVLRLPKQVVIFIEENENIKKFVECEIELYNSIKRCYDNYNYKIPTYKLFAHSMEELKRKHLSILLPFKISELNKALKKSKTEPEKRKILEQLIPLVNQVLDYLRNEYKKGFLDFNQFERICNAIKYTSDFFYKKLKPYYKLEENIEMEIKSALTEEDKKIIREEGMQKGRKEGMQKGRKEGMQKGRKEGERKKAIQTAKKLKKWGMENKKIVEATGLTMEEVEKLKS